MVGVFQRDNSLLLGPAELRQYCSAIFSATSTAVEPSSEKKIAPAPAAARAATARPVPPPGVRESGKNYVLERARLLGDGRRDPRMRSGRADSPTTRKSRRSAAPVGGVQIDSLGALDQHWARIERLLREWMPDGKMRLRGHITGNTCLSKCGLKACKTSQQRVAINRFEPRNAANHRNVWRNARWSARCRLFSWPIITTPLTFDSRVAAHAR